MQSSSLWVEYGLPLNGTWLAVEPVRHENLVFVTGIAGGEDIGTLKSLIEETEDIEDGNEAASSIVRPRDICVTLRLARIILTMVGKSLTGLHSSQLLV